MKRQYRKGDAGEKNPWGDDGGTFYQDASCHMLKRQVEQWPREERKEPKGAICKADLACMCIPAAVGSTCSKEVVQVVLEIKHMF